MARTTSEAVALIIEVDENISLTSFIEAANALVTEVCSAVTSYDTTRLELIERWLSAHFYAIRDSRPTNERAGSVGASYQSKVDLGFDVTHYGQMAMRLDTAGGLAQLNAESKLGGARTASVTWVGKDTTNREDYIG
jgi:hypothetical protein